MVILEGIADIGSFERVAKSFFFWGLPNDVKPSPKVSTAEISA